MSDKDRFHELDAAIDHLKRALDNPVKGAIGLLAKYDQIRAECRDDPEKRLRVIDALVVQGHTRKDATEWVDRKGSPEL